MYVFKLRVETNDALRKTFCDAEGLYKPCVAGVAYVCAPSFVAAAKKIGEALISIEVLGPCAVVESGEEES